jgi:Leu/Phe-tRNA-protein transferase
MPYIVISPTHIQQMPDEELYPWVDDEKYITSWHKFNKELFDRDMAAYEAHAASLSTILRGDNNTWSIGQVLQDEEVVFEHCCNNNLDKEEIFIGNTTPSDYHINYKCGHCYLKAITKSRPIEELFKQKL